MVVRMLLFSMLIAAVGLLVAAGPIEADDDLFGRVKGLIGDDDEKAESPTKDPSDATGISDMLDSLTGGTDRSTQNGGLSDADIGAGLKEALRVGTEHVVGQLGQTDGFNLDPAIHIPLPKTLTRMQDALGAVGLSHLLDDLELRLNRAAELATPAAKALFVGAIEDMTLEDARGILTGPDDSATRLFQGKMSAPLADAMRPLVDDALQEAGAVQAYDQAITQYKGIPFVPDVKADLTTHVLGLGIDGIFHYIAIEEAAIRKDPVKRTTDLLRRVFG